MSYRLICMDVLDWAANYSGPKFHALLCDPPYEYGFMGKSWDSSGIAFKADTWVALAAHLLPGAFGMAFAGARTHHRIACAIEDAGLTLHPAIYWVYGSGFPKATRISDDAFSGHRYGLQTMKPAAEPIIVFQKPYEGKPVECITKHGSGALWIDGGRVGSGETIAAHHGTGRGVAMAGNLAENWAHPYQPGDSGQHIQTSGRWPANLVLDEEAARLLGEQTGERRSAGLYPSSFIGTGAGTTYLPIKPQGKLYEDQGTAARFFQNVDWSYEVAEQLAGVSPFLYMAKAAASERETGLCGSIPCATCGGMDTLTHKVRRLKASSGVERLNQRNAELGYRPDSYTHGDEYEEFDVDCRRCVHPTVKPIGLTKWLATLLLPPALYAPRRIVVPFGGVASEMIGALLAGWEEIDGIDQDAEYCEIGKARLHFWFCNPTVSFADDAREEEEPPATEAQQLRMI